LVIGNRVWLRIVAFKRGERFWSRIPFHSAIISSGTKVPSTARSKNVPPAAEGLPSTAVELERIESLRSDVDGEAPWQLATGQELRVSKAHWRQAPER
jgi:hypothetical protein